MEERRKLEIERDRLLTQIDTKLTIFITSFDKHIVQNKLDFDSHDARIKGLERLMYLGMGALAVLNIFIKFM